MQFETVKKWLPLMGAGFALWLAAYTVFWVDRVDCNQPVARCISESFGSWVGDVVMLQWVKSYQTLAGGILAVVAASTIILNGAIERRARQADVDLAHRRASLAALSRLRTAFRRAALALITSNDRPEILATMDLIDNELIHAAADFPKMVRRLQHLLGTARLHSRAVANPNFDETGQRQHRVTASALCECGHLFLYFPERLLTGDDVADRKVSVHESTKDTLVWETLDESSKALISDFLAFYE